MLIVIAFIILWCNLSCSIVLNYNTSYILDYVRSRNYPIEVHTIQTKDGYILNIHRIPHGVKTNIKITEDNAVLLVHGLLESAEHWVINGDKGLAFILADQGYDVWMTNARGSYHSRQHVIYDTNRPDYWNFGWHEIGIYDLESTIDYVLLKTKSSKISYIGHSQGHTSFIVLASTDPEYNHKIKIMIALAPATYMAHVKNPLFRTLSRVWELIYPNKGLLDNALVNTIGENVCRDQILIQNLCSNALFLMAGYDYEQLDKDLIPKIMRTFPAGASTKQLVHYLQLVKSGYFRQYDYLTVENLRRYKQVSPPFYDFKNVTAKIALFYAKNDWLATPTDVRKVRDQLPNVVVDHLIEYENFNHWDFLFAKDVVTLLYNDVIHVLNKYNN